MGLVGHVLQLKNHGHQSACIYLNLFKVFNTLDHEFLLLKLECYRVHGTTNKWFSSYLSGHSLVAKVTTGPDHTVYLDSFNITYGMVQVSCLGPLLFIIFYNDLHLLPLYSKIILFANDTTIFNIHYSADFLRLTLLQSHFP